MALGMKSQKEGRSEMPRLIKRNWKLSTIEELMEVLGYNTSMFKNKKGLVWVDDVGDGEWYNDLIDDFYLEVCYELSKNENFFEMANGLHNFLNNGDTYYFTDRTTVYLTNHDDDFDEFALNWIKKWMADHGVKK